jgi:hypothetical protein
MSTLSTGVEIWPRRPLGGELQCGALWPLCEGLLGGSSVEEGIGQPAGAP